MKLDICGADNLLRVNDGDENKLPFQTTYGLFQPTVKQFGTTNATADLEGCINNPIRDVQDDVAPACLDDILIHSNSEIQHEDPVM